SRTMPTSGGRIEASISLPARAHGRYRFVRGGSAALIRPGPEDPIAAISTGSREGIWELPAQRGHLLGVCVYRFPDSLRRLIASRTQRNDARQIGEIRA